MNSLVTALRRILLVLAVFLAGPALAEDAASNQVKVVYHIDDAQVQGLKALRNIRNHLDVAPDTKIVVVTHADGVDLLMEGAKDAKSGSEYAPLIAGLKARGVTFEVCEITMKRRNLTKQQFIMDADFTPSGVVRLGELQFREHYAYVKP